MKPPWTWYQHHFSTQDPSFALIIWESSCTYLCPPAFLDFKADEFRKKLHHREGTKNFSPYRIKRNKEFVIKRICIICSTKYDNITRASIWILWSNVKDTIFLFIIFFFTTYVITSWFLTHQRYFYYLLIIICNSIIIKCMRSSIFLCFWLSFS